MKKTLGRRKIEIKKLEKKSNKQVTFSKRRSGLFKKASELSILCGAEIAILVFSPNDKVFSFGHPNVESLLDRFVTGNSCPSKSAESYIPVAEFNQNFINATRELENEKKHAVKVIEEAKIAKNSGRFWWDEPIENMKIEELKQFRSALQDLRGEVTKKVEKLMEIRNGGPLLPALPPLSTFQVDGNHHCTSLSNNFGLGFL